MRTCFYNISALCLLVVLLPLSGLFAESPDTETILEAFRNSFNWMDNCSFTSTGVYWDVYDPNDLRKEELTVYNDEGLRQRTIQQIRRVDGETDTLLHIDNDPQEFHTDSILSEQTQGFLFRGHGRTEIDRFVEIFEEGPQRSQMYFDALQTREFAGFFYGQEKPLQEILTSDLVKNIEKVELDGQASYMLEAELDVGFLTLWLDPDMGYAMQKWRVVSNYETHLAEYEVPESPDSAQGDVTARNEVLDYLECVFTGHQNIQGYFIPMKYDRTFRHEFGSDQKTIVEKTVELTKVELFPDFDASGAFELPDYSRVKFTDFIRKDNTSISGFKWEDGHLVAPMDEQFVDTKLLEGLAAIHTTPSENTKVPAKLSLLVNKLDPEAAAQMKEEAWLYILTAAGLIVLIGAWIAYRIVKRRRESK